MMYYSMVETANANADGNADGNGSDHSEPTQNYETCDQNLDNSYEMDVMD